MGCSASLAHNSWSRSWLYKDFLLYGGSATGKINSKLAAVFNAEFLSSEFLSSGFSENKGLGGMLSLVGS